MAESLAFIVDTLLLLLETPADTHLLALCCAQQFSLASLQSFLSSYVFDIKWFEGDDCYTVSL